jgi:dihydrodipicolinate synthase/N-acetylneuraminate lyase
VLSAFEGLFGIIPTPTRDDAGWAGPESTVDLIETERLVGQLVADGVNGLIILGTTGECATLTRPEADSVAACVVETVAQRVPVYVGATALGTHDVVDRLRFIQDLGADGTLLGLPMWQPLTREMAVSFYESISATFPDLPVIVYANQRAFRFSFDADFWRALVERAPTAIAAKFSKPDRLLEYQTASAGRVHFLPHETAAHRFSQLSPDTTSACWSTAASMGPEPSLAMIDAVRRGDQEGADAVARDLAYANEPIGHIVSDPDIFASYNIQIEKTRIAAAGYCRPGAARPPYDLMPDEYRAAADECGRRWAQIRLRYVRSGPASDGAAPSGEATARE